MKKHGSESKQIINQADPFPRLSHRELVVLEMLVHNMRGAYGLQMVEESKGVLKKGTIYVVLQRMEDRGLINSKIEPRIAPEIGIARRMYSLTGYGQRVYRAYLAARQVLSPELVPISG